MVLRFLVLGPGSTLRDHFALLRGPICDGRDRILAAVCIANTLPSVL